MADPGLPARRPRAGASDGGDTFPHTEQFLLVDRDGHIRGVYNGANLAAMEQLASDVEVLRREG